MYTFNGVGTTLYGKRAVDADGSYLATKWVVLVFLPVLPLGSYRVWRGSTHRRLLGTSTDYHLERVPLCWRQVLNCYLASLFLGPLVVYLFGGGLALWAWQAWRG